jgi:acyl-CoA thioesterase FadM
MNNGRYLTICDLTRVDMFMRTGLAKTMIKEKWRPIIAEHTMIYKKPLKPFQKYELVMNIVDWDDRRFYLTHQFIANGVLMAEGTSQGVIVGAEGVVKPETVIERVNYWNKK